MQRSHRGYLAAVTRCDADDFRNHDSGISVHLSLAGSSGYLDGSSVKEFEQIGMDEFEAISGTQVRPPLDVTVGSN